MILRVPSIALFLALSTPLAAGCGTKAPPAPTAAPPTVPAPTAAAATAAAATAPAPTEADAAPATAPAPTAPTEADAAPAGTEADATAAPKVPVAEACAALTAKSQAVIDEAKKKVASAENKDALAPSPIMSQGCLGEAPYDKGTWALAVDSAEVGKDEYGGAPTLSLATALVWIGPDGTKASSPPIGYMWGTGGTMLRKARTEDFNGDGVPELIVSTGTNSPDHSTVGLALYRVVGDKVEEWRVEPPVARVEDIDGDGVPDFLHAGTFETTQGMNSLGEPFMAATHIGPNGALEKTGPAITAYYKKQCPTKVTVAEIATEKEYLKAAACAWLYGATLETIAPAVKARLKKEDATAAEISSGWWSAEGTTPPVVLE